MTNEVLLIDLERQTNEGIQKLADNFDVILKLFNEQQDEVVRLEKWIQRHEKRIKELEKK